jgi:hypothetical protein
MTQISPYESILQHYATNVKGENQQLALDLRELAVYIKRRTMQDEGKANISAR